MEGIVLYISIIHKNLISRTVNNLSVALVLVWLFLMIAPMNTFAFSGVGETAQGNKTCKLIKLLGLVK